MSFFRSRPAKSLNDTQAAGLIAHFEHSYNARLVAYEPQVSRG